MLDNFSVAVMEKRKFRLLAIIVGYVVFCGVSLLSRFVYPFFGLVVL